MPPYYHFFPLFALSVCAHSLWAEDIETIEVVSSANGASAITADQLIADDIGVYQLDSLSSLTDHSPNLFISNTLVNSKVSLRGMSSGDDRSFSSSVAMFKDGIYLARGRMALSQWLDMEGVEVYRGPQTINYGLNATAGAFAMHSKRSNADDDFSLVLKSSHEFEYNASQYTAIVGGGVGPVGLRFAASTLDQDELWTQNSEPEEQSIKNDIARLSAVFKISDTFSTDFSYEYSHFEQQGQATEVINGELNLAGDLPSGLGLQDRISAMNSFATASGLALWNLGSENSQADSLSHHQTDASIYNKNAIAIKSKQSTVGVEQNSQLATVGFNGLINDWVLSAKLGYLDNDHDQLINGAGLAENIYYAASFEEYTQSSGQFDIASDQEGAIRFKTGVYVHSSELFTEQPNAIRPDFFAALVTGFPVELVQQQNFNGFDVLELFNASLNEEGTLFSAYGEVAFDLADTWELALGLRHTQEDKKYLRNAATDGSSIYLLQPDNTVGPDTGSALVNATGKAVGASSGEVDSSYTLPELRLSWRATDAMQVFARYAENAKPAGIAAAGSTPADKIEYKEEYARSLELGLSHQLPANNVSYGLNAFVTQYEDLQVKTTVIANTGPISYIDNAAEAESFGVELFSAWAVTDALTMGTNVAWLQAQYKDFVDAPCSRSAPTNCDKSGETLPFAPALSGNIYAAYHHAISADLSLISGINLAFSSDYMIEGTLESTLEQESWQRLSAYIGLEGNGGLWDVLLTGKNLNDVYVLGGAIPLQGYDLVYPEAGRQVYLQVSLKL